jgi:hypothetical protein
MGIILEIHLSHTGHRTFPENEDLLIQPHTATIGTSTAPEALATTNARKIITIRTMANTMSIFARESGAWPVARPV